MDVRSIEDVEPVAEHNGTVPVWWLVNPREMHAITDGGFLELVSEFEVAGGGEVDPHSHPTHEFYYVTSGRGLMRIADEEHEIVQGDLVHIPPNAVHSLRPISDHAPIHCFCFAVGLKDAGEVDTRPFASTMLAKKVNQTLQTTRSNRSVSKHDSLLRQPMFQESRRRARPCGLPRVFPARRRHCILRISSG